MESGRRWSVRAVDLWTVVMELEEELLQFAACLFSFAALLSLELNLNRRCDADDEIMEMEEDWRSGQ